MAENLVIYGRAAPFNVTVLYGDGYLCVEQGAFDEWLTAPDCDCVLAWGDHDNFDTLATTADRSLKLIANASGVWFTAILGPLDENYGRRGAITRRRRPVDRVSVSFITYREKTDEYLGCARRRLARCAADHILITPEAAFGAHTAAWPANLPLDEAPWRIQCFDLEFRDMMSSDNTVKFNFAYRSGKR